MLLSGRRKDIQDDNNYIGKFGKITHICPRCKNLYVADIRLNVECNIMSSDNSTGYTVETPLIDKKCICGHNTTQIDNSIGVILKILMEKGYKIIESCEGHAYLKNQVLCYDFPLIKISGHIKSLIPKEYHKKFKINHSFQETIIAAKFKGYKDLSLEFFNEFKTNTIKDLKELVDSLPKDPYCPCIIRHEDRHV